MRRFCGVDVLCLKKMIKTHFLGRSLASTHTEAFLANVIGISEILSILVLALHQRPLCKHKTPQNLTESFPPFLTHAGLQFWTTHISTSIGFCDFSERKKNNKKQLASIPRMKGPALLALLPDIPVHCSLLVLPDVSPAPLSDERRLDILELCGRTNLISSRDKDSKVQVHARGFKLWMDDVLIIDFQTTF